MLSLICVWSDGNWPYDWMLLKGSRPRVLSRFRVKRSLHCACVFCRLPPWSLKQEYTSPAFEYACRGNYSYSLNDEHPYRIMPSQSPHPVTSPVVWNFQSLANCQNQQMRGPSGNSQLLPAKRRVSVPAGERDSFQWGSSVASTMQGQNSTPSSSPNHSRVAGITQRAISTTSTTQQQSTITPTATPGRSSRNTPAPSGTTQTDSTRRVVSSPASSIANTPTPLSGLEILPTSISNLEARGIITNPLQMRATEMNQRHR